MNLLRSKNRCNRKDYMHDAMRGRRNTFDKRKSKPAQSDDEDYDSTEEVWTLGMVNFIPSKGSTFYRSPTPKKYSGFSFPGFAKFKTTTAVVAEKAQEVTQTSPITLPTEMSSLPANKAVPSTSRARITSVELTAERKTTLMNQEAPITHSKSAQITKDIDTLEYHAKVDEAKPYLNEKYGPQGEKAPHPSVITSELESVDRFTQPPRMSPIITTKRVPLPESVSFTDRPMTPNEEIMIKEPPSNTKSDISEMETDSAKIGTTDEYGKINTITLVTDKTIEARNNLKDSLNVNAEDEDEVLTGLRTEPMLKMTYPAMEDEEDMNIATKRILGKPSESKEGKLTTEVSLLQGETERMMLGFEETMATTKESVENKLSGDLVQIDQESYTNPPVLVPLTVNPQDIAAEVLNYSTEGPIIILKETTSDLENLSTESFVFISSNTPSLNVTLYPVELLITNRVSTKSSKVTESQSITTKMISSEETRPAALTSGKEGASGSVPESTESISSESISNTTRESAGIKNKSEETNETSTTSSKTEISSGTSQGTVTEFNESTNGTSSSENLQEGKTLITQGVATEFTESTNASSSSEILQNVSTTLSSSSLVETSTNVSAQSLSPSEETTSTPKSSSAVESLTESLASQITKSNEEKTEEGQSVGVTSSKSAQESIEGVNATTEISGGSTGSTMHTLNMIGAIDNALEVFSSSPTISPVTTTSLNLYTGEESINKSFSSTNPEGETSYFKEGKNTTEEVIKSSSMSEQSTLMQRPTISSDFGEQSVSTKSSKYESSTWSMGISEEQTITTIKSMENKTDLTSVGSSLEEQIAKETTVLDIAKTASAQSTASISLNVTASLPGQTGSSEILAYTGGSTEHTMNMLGAIDNALEIFSKNSLSDQEMKQYTLPGESVEFGQKTAESVMLEGQSTQGTSVGESLNTTSISETGSTSIKSSSESVSPGEDQNNTVSGSAIAQSLSTVEELTTNAISNITSLNQAEVTLTSGQAESTNSAENNLSTLLSTSEETSHEPLSSLSTQTGNTETTPNPEVSTSSIVSSTQTSESTKSEFSESVSVSRELVQNITKENKETSIAFEPTLGHATFSQIMPAELGTMGTTPFITPFDLLQNTEFTFSEVEPFGTKSFLNENQEISSLFIQLTPGLFDSSTIESIGLETSDILHPITTELQYTENGIATESFSMNFPELEATLSPVSTFGPLDGNLIANLEAEGMSSQSLIENKGIEGVSVLDMNELNVSNIVENTTPIFIPTLLSEFTINNIPNETSSQQIILTRPTSTVEGLSITGENVGFQSTLTIKNEETSSISLTDITSTVTETINVTESSEILEQSSSELKLTQSTKEESSTYSVETTETTENLQSTPMWLQSEKNLYEGSSVTEHDKLTTDRIHITIEEPSTKAKHRWHFGRSKTSTTEAYQGLTVTSADEEETKLVTSEDEDEQTSAKTSLHGKHVSAATENTTEMSSATNLEEITEETTSEQSASKTASTFFENEETTSKILTTGETLAEKEETTEEQKTHAQVHTETETEGTPEEQNTEETSISEMFSKETESLVTETVEESSKTEKHGESSSAAVFGSVSGECIGCSNTTSPVTEDEEYVKSTTSRSHSEESTKESYTGSSKTAEESVEYTSEAKSSKSTLELETIKTTESSINEPSSESTKTEKSSSVHTSAKTEETVAEETESSAEVTEATTQSTIKPKVQTIPSEQESVSEESGKTSLTQENKVSSSEISVSSTEEISETSTKSEKETVSKETKRVSLTTEETATSAEIPVTSSEVSETAAHIVSTTEATLPEKSELTENASGESSEPSSTLATSISESSEIVEKGTEKSTKSLIETTLIHKPSTTEEVKVELTSSSSVPLISETTTLPEKSSAASESIKSSTSSTAKVFTEENQKTSVTAHTMNMIGAIDNALEIFSESANGITPLTSVITSVTGESTISQKTEEESTHETTISSVTTPESIKTVSETSILSEHTVSLSTETPMGTSKQTTTQIKEKSEEEHTHETNPSVTVAESMKTQSIASETTVLSTSEINTEVTTQIKEKPEENLTHETSSLSSSKTEPTPTLIIPESTVSSSETEIFTETNVETLTTLKTSVTTSLETSIGTEGATSSEKIGATTTPQETITTEAITSTSIPTTAGETTEIIKTTMVNGTDTIEVSTTTSTKTETMKTENETEASTIQTLSSSTPLPTSATGAIATSTMAPEAPKTEMQSTLEVSSETTTPIAVKISSIAEAISSVAKQLTSVLVSTSNILTTMSSVQESASTVSMTEEATTKPSTVPTILTTIANMISSPQSESSTAGISTSSEPTTITTGSSAQTTIVSTTLPISSSTANGTITTLSGGNNTTTLHPSHKANISEMVDELKHNGGKKLKKAWHNLVHKVKNIKHNKTTTAPENLTTLSANHTESTISVVNGSTASTQTSLVTTSSTPVLVTNTPILLVATPSETTLTTISTQMSSLITASLTSALVTNTPTSTVLKTESPPETTLVTTTTPMSSTDLVTTKESSPPPLPITTVLETSPSTSSAPPTEELSTTVKETSTVAPQTEVTTTTVEVTTTHFTSMSSTLSSSVATDILTSTEPLTSTSSPEPVVSTTTTLQTLPEISSTTPLLPNLVTSQSTTQEAESHNMLNGSSSEGVTGSTEASKSKMTTHKFTLGKIDLETMSTPFVISQSTFRLDQVSLLSPIIYTTHLTHQTAPWTTTAAPHTMNIIGAIDNALEIFENTPKLATVSHGKNASSAETTPTSSETVSALNLESSTTEGPKSTSGGSSIALSSVETVSMENISTPVATETIMSSNVTHENVSETTEEPKTTIEASSIGLSSVETVSIGNLSTTESIENKISSSIPAENVSETTTEVKSTAESPSGPSTSTTTIGTTIVSAETSTTGLQTAETASAENLSSTVSIENTLSSSKPSETISETTQEPKTTAELQNGPLTSTITNSSVIVDSETSTTGQPTVETVSTEIFSTTKSIQNASSTSETISETTKELTAESQSGSSISTSMASAETSSSSELSSSIIGSTTITEEAKVSSVPTVQISETSTGQDTTTISSSISKVEEGTLSTLITVGSTTSAQTTESTTTTVHPSENQTSHKVAPEVFIPSMDITVSTESQSEPFNLSYLATAKNLPMDIKKLLQLSMSSTNQVPSSSVANSMSSQTETVTQSLSSPTSNATAETSGELPEKFTEKTLTSTVSTKEPAQEIPEILTSSKGAVSVEMTTISEPTIGTTGLSMEETKTKVEESSKPVETSASSEISTLESTPITVSTKEPSPQIPEILTSSKGAASVEMTTISESTIGTTGLSTEETKTKVEEASKPVESSAISEISTVQSTPSTVSTKEPSPQIPEILTSSKGAGSVEITTILETTISSTGLSSEETKTKVEESSKPVETSASSEISTVESTPTTVSSQIAEESTNGISTILTTSITGEPSTSVKLGSTSLNAQEISEVSTSHKPSEKTEESTAKAIVTTPEQSSTNTVQSQPETVTNEVLTTMQIETSTIEVISKSQTESITTESTLASPSSKYSEVSTSLTSERITSEYASKSSISESTSLPSTEVSETSTKPAEKTETLTSETIIVLTTAQMENVTTLKQENMLTTEITTEQSVNLTLPSSSMAVINETNKSAITAGVFIPSPEVTISTTAPLHTLETTTDFAEFMTASHIPVNIKKLLEIAAASTHHTTTSQEETTISTEPNTVMKQLMSLASETATISVVSSETPVSTKSVDLTTESTTMSISTEVSSKATSLNVPSTEEPSTVIVTYLTSSQTQTTTGTVEQETLEVTTTEEKQSHSRSTTTIESTTLPTTSNKESTFTTPPTTSSEHKTSEESLGTTKSSTKEIEGHQHGAASDVTSSKKNLATTNMPENVLEEHQGLDMHHFGTTGTTQTSSTGMSIEEIQNNNMTAEGISATKETVQQEPQCNFTTPKTGANLPSTATFKDVYINLPTFFANSTSPIPNFEMYFTTEPNNSTEHDEQDDQTVNTLAYKSMRLHDFDKITEFVTIITNPLGNGTTNGNVSVSVSVAATKRDGDSLKTTQMLTPTIEVSAKDIGMTHQTDITTASKSSTRIDTTISIPLSLSTSITIPGTSLKLSETTKPNLTSTESHNSISPNTLTTTLTFSSLNQTTTSGKNNVSNTEAASKGHENTADGKKSYICSVDKMVKELQENMRSKNINGSLAASMCEAFIPIENGIKLNRRNHKRSKRSLNFFGNTPEEPKEKREIIPNNDIKTTLGKDFNIKNTDIHRYAMPGSRIEIPCAEGKNFSSKNFTIKWTNANGASITDGNVEETGSGLLVIENVTPSDGGNYTCTISNNASSIRTFNHELSIISLATFDINTTILYGVSKECLDEDKEVMKTYFHGKIGDMLCGQEHKICSIEVQNITCFVKDTHPHLYVSLVFHVESMNVIVPVLNTVTCDILCQMKVYAKLVSVIVNNIQVFETQPVMYRQSRDVVLSPTINSGSNITTDAPKLILGCPSGFGVMQDKHICLACDKNMFSPGGEAHCSHCPPRHYQPSVGSKSCLKCTSPLQDSACLSVMIMEGRRYKVLAYSAAAFLASVALICSCLHCCRRNKTVNVAVNPVQKSPVAIDLEKQAVMAKVAERPAVSREKLLQTSENVPPKRRRRVPFPKSRRAPPIPVLEPTSNVNRVPPSPPPPDF